MENDIFNVPIGMPNLNPIVTDGMSLAQPNFLGLNHQNHIMDGFPVISMLQSEPMNHINEGLHLANPAEFSNSISLPSINSHFGRNITSVGSSYPINATEVPISATALASLLAARYSSNGNLNNLETSPLPAHPMEVQKRPSIGTSMNFGLDGIVGDMSSKWDFNNPLTPTELSRRIPERLGFQPHQSGWISSESTSVSSDSPSGSSRFSNELSLSLATCSDMSYSGVSNLCLHEQRRLGSEQASCKSNNLSLASFGSHKPIQVLQLLSGTGYLQMMQEILAEIASYSLGSLENTSFCYGGTAGYKGTGFDDILCGNARVDMQMEPVLRGYDSEAKRKHLLGLLQLVDDRFIQCMDEIHTVISAFHAVTELDPQLHARFTLQTISFFYKSLRERISNHILAMGADCNRRDTVDEKSYETSFLPKQWALQQLRRKDHQLWRPQRGLPEKSVSVLRAWMFQNFLHPYPKDAEKQLLAVKSGLTRSQVSNWFINARVRIWKPMIDEMYAEMNRRRGCQNDEDTESNHRNHISIIDGRRFKMN